MSEPRNDNHVPGPSLWPIGFAIGVACLLLGLVVSWIVAAVGAALAIVFGLLWARDVTRDVRGDVPHVAPETRVVADAAAPYAGEEEPLPAFTRSRFLEATTLGLAGVMGGVLTVPVLGFMVLPAFTNLDEYGNQVDLGPIDNFPEGSFVVATFLEDPKVGEVTRRTTFIRNNGQGPTGQPSFTILYSRCVHLGCPVQPNGPIDEKGTKHFNNVELRPVLAASFGCPCHGGLYDSEGNRTAGPPVRSLDRFEYSIKNGHLILDKTFAVAKVTGNGATAKIAKYSWSVPGTHVNGIEGWLYPIVPSQVTG